MPCLATPLFRWAHQIGTRQGCRARFASLATATRDFCAVPQELADRGCWRELRTLPSPGRGFGIRFVRKIGGSWCKTAPAGFCQYLAGGARLHLIASALSQPLKNLPDMATNVSMASATHRGGRPIFRITPPVCFLAEPPLEKGARIDAGRTVALNQDQIAAMVLRSCQAVRARRAHP